MEAKSPSRGVEAGTVCEAGMEEVACPLCRGARKEVAYRSDHHNNGLGAMTVSVVLCADCGFLFTSPRPDQQARDAYYAGSALASGQVYRDETETGLFPRLYAQRVAFLADLLSHRPGGRLLDIGCGNGGFLRALIKQGPAGWQWMGLEPSRHAVDNCRQHGLEVLCGGIGDDCCEPGSLDVISMISVLEHLPDPLSSLHWCRRMLKPDGLLSLEVPDNLHPELSLTSHFNIEHIVHFTPWTLQRMLQEAGFGESVRDRSVSGVIRIASAASLGDWGRASDLPPSDDLDDLRRIVTDYGVAEKELLGSVLQRVGAALQRWRGDGLRIAVYGAGVHSAQLAALLDFTGDVTCFIDGDPAKQGRDFLGVPVCAPEQLVALGVGAVLISSNRFVDEMIVKVRQVGGPSVAIETCYA